MPSIMMYSAPTGPYRCFRSGALAVLAAISTLQGLSGCTSSPESGAEYRGYEYQYDLAERFRLGKGVEKDPTKAAYWYYQAARSPSENPSRGVGHPGAQMRLAEAYKEGEGVEKDYGKALYWYELVADDKDSRAAMYEIGELYRTGGPGLPADQVMAVQWYRESAEEGMNWAQYRLAEAYRTGDGVEKDPDEAARLYEAAAEQGNHWAMLALGDLYRAGTGVNQDSDQAVQWYTRAAEQGNEHAALRIAGF